ncbi:MAG: agmatine deiminase family protein [Verrucomicrobiota bacterium]
MADLGPVRLPAEWEEQEAIWLSWPVSELIWPGKREAIWQAFAELASQLSYFEPVKINAAGSAHEEIREKLNAVKADLSVITLYDHPTDDVWCRDHGAIFVKQDGKLAASDWQFNAWGGKYEPYDLDNALAAKMAEAVGVPITSSELILEGGAIECNGAGLLLTTETVLLNDNRNPDWSRAQVEAELGRMLGVNEIVWLPRGLDHDDTDGHIDNVTRFIGENAVLTCVSDTQPQLIESRRLLSDRFETVIDLPLPELITLESKPSSYANYALVNDAVLVPCYSQPANDDRAAGIIGECFPGRKIVPVDCRLFLEEGGAVHCLTQHQPV